MWLGCVTCVECPICRRVGEPFSSRSAWCSDCTESMLAEQLVEMRNFRQDPEIVTQLRVVECP